MAISLESIQEGTALKAPKVIVYGPGGVGKTTFAAGADRPIFAFTEEGLGTLGVARFPLITSWEDLIESCSVIHSGEHNYGTFVIDSLDRAEALCWDYLCRSRDKSGIEAFGFGKGYTFAVEEFQVLLDWLDAIRTDRGMSIILIAHAAPKKFDDPMTESYDVWDLAVHDKLIRKVDHWADATLFATYDVSVKKDSGGFKDRTRAQGRGERVLYAEKRPAWRAKNRYRLPWKMRLDYQEFVDAINSTVDGESSFDEQQPTDNDTPDTTPAKRTARPSRAPKGKTTTPTTETETD